MKARIAVSLMAITAGVVSAACAHWPLWAIAPGVALMCIYLAWVVGPARRISDVLAVVGMLIAAGTAAIVVNMPRPSPPDAEIIDSTTRAVRALNTFDATNPIAWSHAMESQSTGLLRLDIARDGVNAVLEQAVALHAQVSISITNAGIDRSDADTARVLVYAQQRIVVPGSPVSRVPIARWANMRKVAGQWRLAEIYPAGIDG